MVINPPAAGWWPIITHQSIGHSTSWQSWLSVAGGQAAPIGAEGREKTVKSQGRVVKEGPGPMHLKTVKGSERQ